MMLLVGWYFIVQEWLEDEAAAVASAVLAASGTG